MSTAEWLSAMPSQRLLEGRIKVDGQPFSLRRYPYLVELLNGPNGCRVRQSDTLKGAQMGFTITEILRCLDDAIHLPHLRGIGYFFPTQHDAQDFAKARFGSILENDVFANAVGNTDSASLKQIGKTWLYFRGAGPSGTSPKQNLSPVKSIPLDIIDLDESDEMSEARKDAIYQRVSGSECPEIRRLSTPTLPAYGVDLDYKDSDQRTWHWKCDRCNEWTCLELTFPDCIAETAEPHYLCASCREPLRMHHGQWVAKHPEKLGNIVQTPSGPTYDGHVGYWVSQLCSPTRSAADILFEQVKAERNGRMREFYNQVLARPYAELEDALTKEVIDECLTDQPRMNRDPGPCVMGVDPGVKKTWYWVKHRVSERVSRTLTYGYVGTFSELAAIAKAFNVKCGVIDGMAETHAVREFVSSHPGWWMCRYVQAPKAGPDWNAKERRVSVGRTECLDASHAKIVSHEEQLPAPDERYHDLVVPHLTNMARMRKENEVTGDVRMEWVIVGGQKNDHLKHAHGYATLAEERVGMAQQIQMVRRRAREARRNSSGKRRSFMGS